MGRYTTEQDKRYTARRVSSMSDSELKSEFSRLQYGNYRWQEQAQRMIHRELRKRERERGNPMDDMYK